MYEKELQNVGLEVGKNQAFNPENVNQETNYQKQMDALNNYNAPANNSNNDYYNEQLFGVPKETSETYTQYQDYNENFFDKFNVSVNINLFLLFCFILVIIIVFIVSKRIFKK